jgi:RNA polymerase sigma-70 factor (ECF subfamily)
VENKTLAIPSGQTTVEASTTPTDNQLVARTLNGDVGAFNDLVARWETALYHFVVRYLGDTEEARDICQEAFLKAYTNLDRFRGQAKFSSWLFQIALNQCRTQFRRKKSRPTVSLDEDDEMSHLRLVPADAESPDASAIKSQHATELQVALAALPEDQRTAIILKEYHGLKFREIAEVLETPESTIKSRLYHGLESLAKSLGHLKTEGLQP